MNQKQHEQLNLDSYKNRSSTSIKKNSGLTTSNSDHLDLTTHNEIHNKTLPINSYFEKKVAADKSSSPQKKNVYLNVMSSKNPSENSEIFDALIFENKKVQTKSNDLKEDLSKLNSADFYLDSISYLNEDKDKEFSNQIDIESHNHLISSNNSSFSKCFTKLYTNNKSSNEKISSSVENLKNVFEKSCLFSNRNENNDKSSEFRHYKDNASRRESKTSLPDFHQAITAFQAKRIKENNAKLNATKKTALKAKVYNFLERPSGWLCFIYHFTV